MFENIHYSYSVLLSHYTFAVLVLGVLASLYSNKIASAMKLIGLLGLLTFNVSSVYMAEFKLLRIINPSLEVLRILRIMLLCALPWAILSLCADMLEVCWKKIRRITIFYSISFSILYLIISLIFPEYIGIQEDAANIIANKLNFIQILEIIIYLVLALYSIILPIACLRMGIANTLGQCPLRFWYKDTAMSMLICAVFQVLAFIPLYLSYFPSLINIQKYAELNVTPRRINFMPIYYLFFTLPFIVHVLYILSHKEKLLDQQNPQLFTRTATGKTATDSLLRELPQAATQRTTFETPPQMNLEAALSTDPSQNLSQIQSVGNESASMLSSLEAASASNKSNDLQYLEKFGTRYNISKREQEVLIELIQGRSYAAIAERLYISLATVKSHIYSIYRKTAVKNKIQLLNRILKE